MSIYLQMEQVTVLSVSVSAALELTLSRLSEKFCEPLADKGQSVHRRYGDSLRSGWRNLLACVVRLFQLNLLPPSVLLLESEDAAAARERIPRPSASRPTPASASLLSRAFSRCIYTPHALPQYRFGRHYAGSLQRLGFRDRAELRLFR